MKHRTVFLSIFLLMAAAGLAQQPGAAFDPRLRPRQLTDDQLLDQVQRQTIRYFWDFAHPVSGMARERSNVAYDYGDEVVTTGGTGFGVMALIVGVERGWLPRDTVARHLLKMVKFLGKADAYHGVFPHWLHGATGKTIPFSRKDDGADLVETSFLMQGLLCVRAYFDRDDNAERELRTWISLKIKSYRKRR